MALCSAAACVGLAGSLGPPLPGLMSLPFLVFGTEVVVTGVADAGAMADAEDPAGAGVAEPLREVSNSTDTAPAARTNKPTAATPSHPLRSDPAP